MKQFDDEQENAKLVSLGQLKQAAENKAALFDRNHRYHREKLRLKECADNVLTFESATRGPINLTWYCKHRHCPICQDRYSARWVTAMKWIWQQMKAKADQPHWLFLTLTVRNCPVTELRSQIQAMNKAFARMTERNAWQHVRGSIRFLEVDQGQDDAETAHPHFHCLLLVTPSMHGGKNYLSQARWAQLWQECLQVHYTPEVDVQRLPPVGQSADLEVLRRVSYSTKPQPQIPDADWFLEMVQQLRYSQRAIATGELKAWIKRFQEANQVWHLNEFNIAPEDDPHKRYYWDSGQGLYVQGSG